MQNILNDVQQFNIINLQLHECPHLRGRWRNPAHCLASAVLWYQTWPGQHQVYSRPNNSPSCLAPHSPECAVLPGNTLYARSTHFSALTTQPGLLYWPIRGTGSQPPLIYTRGHQHLWIFKTLWRQDWKPLCCDLKHSIYAEHIQINKTIVLQSD